MSGTSVRRRRAGTLSPKIAPGETPGRPAYPAHRPAVETNYAAGQALTRSDIHPAGTLGDVGQRRTVEPDLYATLREFFLGGIRTARALFEHVPVRAVSADETHGRRLATARTVAAASAASDTAID